MNVKHNEPGLEILIVKYYGNSQYKFERGLTDYDQPVYVTHESLLQRADSAPIYTIEPMEMIEMKFKLLSGRVGKISEPVLFETGYETLVVKINYERFVG